MEAIDVHVHIVPQRFVDLMRGQALREIVEVEQAADVDRLQFLPPPGVNVEPDTSIRPHLYEPRLILDAIDRRGLDVAAVSPPPEFFLYWVPPELGLTIARAFNDGFASSTSVPRPLPAPRHPPHAGPLLAAAELERAVTERGLRGAAICTHVNGADLDGPDSA